MELTLFRSPALEWRDGRPALIEAVLDEKVVHVSDRELLPLSVEKVWFAYLLLEGRAVNILEVAPESFRFEIGSFKKQRRDLAELLENEFRSVLEDEEWEALGGDQLVNDLLPFGRDQIELTFSGNDWEMNEGVNWKVSIPGVGYSAKEAQSLPDPLRRFIPLRIAPAPLEPR